MRIRTRRSVLLGSCAPGRYGANGRGDDPEVSGRPARPCYGSRPAPHPVAGCWPALIRSRYGG